MLRNAVGGGRVSDFPDNFKRYKDVQLTVVSVARGWGCQISPTKELRRYTVMLNAHLPTGNRR